MNPKLFLLFGTFTCLVLTQTLEASAEPDAICKGIDVHIIAANRNTISVQLSNQSRSPIIIWGNENNSYAYNNWSFEVFKGNRLITYTRKADQGFTLNNVYAITIPSGGKIKQSLNLTDGSWEAHDIPIFPKYGNEDATLRTESLVVIFVISETAESKRQHVATGIATASSVIGGSTF